MTDSVLLNRQCKDQLRKWIGRRTKFSTLYRLTRDGVDAAVFHANCNGKGANITVAKLPAGNIIGGYTSLSWLSAGGYRSDPTAFLFSLVSGGGFNPLRVPIRAADGANAIYDVAANGPTFGDAHDLIFFTNTALACATNVDSAHGYVAQAGGPFELAAGKQNGWTVVELEVIDVSQEETLMPNPWVPYIRWTEDFRDGLKSTICNYIPRYANELGVPFANCLVIGGTGAGKTTFLSSLASAMLGRMSSISSRGTGTDSLTLSLMKNALDNVPGVRLWDSKGWSPSTYKSGEMGYILDGNIPHGFSLLNPITPEALGFIASPKLAHKVHVVFILVGADMGTDSTYLGRIREFRDMARQRGIPILVGLTKVDLIDRVNLESEELDGSAIQNVFKSYAIQDVIRSIASATDILPLKGYCAEYEYATSILALDIYVDILELFALNKILECADDFFIAKRNSQIRSAEDAAPPMPQTTPTPQSI